MSFEQDLIQVLSQTNFANIPFKVEKLAGEASYREYFRIHLENNSSLILMKMPAGIQSASEEVMKSSKKIDELPFINVQKYLAALELPVPIIHTYSQELGLMILQDLGDESLEKTIKKANHQQTLFFYKQAIDLLSAFQTKTQARNEDCIAFHRKFDDELLMWEFDHFIEYGIEDRLSIQMDEAEKAKLREIGQKIVDHLIKTPQTLVHRDFQSRNLILNSYRFWMIDFQDALIGPMIYDLVALLRDSYIELTQEDIDILVKYYVENVPDNHPYSNKFDAASKDFVLMTLQRKLKDTGRFQYIDTVKKNPSFLCNVVPSLSYVKNALDQAPEYQEITTILSHYLPEFKEQ